MIKTCARAFVLLEAVIALLIVSMVCLSALQAMEMLQASAERFRASSDMTRARYNAIALLRHVDRSKLVKTGRVEYGPYTVSWEGTSAATFSYRVMTVMGLTGPFSAGVERLMVVTRLDGREIDRFETLVVAPEAGASAPTGLSGSTGLPPLPQR